jgi:WD40 repeat protein/tRNA A-37 threonylcarbamoyl transferase component Bud32
MTERDVFLGALDREDPAARAAYLDAACAGQPALRQRVEKLLWQHEKTDTFLSVPALEQVLAAEASLAFLKPPLESGSLGRLDHYEVLEVIGRGSTGVVFKARDCKLHRVVAVKALAPRLAASAAARQRFVQEAQAAAAVRDDNVVSIHAVSEDGPVPYLVMEYICGLTLEQRLQQGKALDLKEILRIGMQLAAGLAAAHAQGLVHRDIKPANILLENSVQRVKITDFGLARVAAEGGSMGLGTLAGTPLYMSPEQARGEPTDQRTDLFSLGSVLYTLCAGQPAFQAETTAGVLDRVRADTPQPVRDINPNVTKWLCALIGKLHAKQPSARPATAQEVADLLAEQLALLQQPPLGRPPAVVALASAHGSQALLRWFGLPFSRRLTLVLGLVGLLAALTALVALLMGWHRGGLKPGDGGVSPRNSGPVESLELQREAISHALLVQAGAGDPALAPPELAAVLGDGRFLFPRAGRANWMAQSPNGKVLAVPLDEEVILFDARSGDYLQRLPGPGSRVVCVAFSHDSQFLAGSTWHEGVGGAVRVWDLNAGKVLYSKDSPGPKISGYVEFSPDGKCLVGESNQQLLVWNARTGQDIHSIELKQAGLASVCFSPDGRRLAAAVWHAKEIRVFDWDGKKLTLIRTLRGHNGSPSRVVYSPDGKTLASGDGTGFKLWDASTLQLIRTVETPAGQLAFTPDSRTLLAGHTNDKPKAIHTLFRWDMVTQNDLPTISVELGGSPDYLFPTLSRDGKVLFAARGGNNAAFIRAIDVASGNDLHPRRGHADAVNVLAVSSDGRTLASGGQDHRIILWDLATGELRHSLLAHMDSVSGLVFSPDGRQLASAGMDGDIAMWNVSAGTEIWRLRGQSRSQARIQFSPDGRTLAAPTEGGSVKLWAVESGAQVSTLRGHSGVVRCVAFSPDGTRLAAGGENKTVVMHDLASGGSQSFKTPSGILDVAFSPDGLTLAAVGDAPEVPVCLWHLDTNQETAWQGHTGPVHGLAFSPTAPVLATGADDGTIRLWALSDGKPHARIIGPGPFGGPVRSVAFTPDGRYLATANANGTVHVLRVASGQGGQ